MNEWPRRHESVVLPTYYIIQPTGAVIWHGLLCIALWLPVVPVILSGRREVFGPTSGLVSAVLVGAQGRVCVRGTCVTCCPATTETPSPASIPSHRKCVRMSHCAARYPHRPNSRPNH